MKKRALLAASLAALAAPALAQFGGRRRGGMDGGGPGGGPAKAEPTPALEVTLHELHEDLKLGAEQEPLWQRYEDALRALGNDMARERAQRRPEAQMNLMQRIDRVVDAARDRLTALEDIGQAAKALYAKLGPEQQAAADPRLANLMLVALNSAPEGRGPSRSRPAMGSAPSP